MSSEQETRAEHLLSRSVQGLCQQASDELAFEPTRDWPVLRIDHQGEAFGSSRKGWGGSLCRTASSSSGAVTCTGRRVPTEEPGYAAMSVPRFSNYRAGAL